jgi:hypothetical protein
MSELSLLMTQCGTTNVTDTIAIPPSKSKLLSQYFVHSPDIHDPECRFCVLLFRVVMLMGKGTCKQNLYPVGYTWAHSTLCVMAEVD